MTHTHTHGDVVVEMAFSIVCYQGRGCSVRQSISALACAFSVSTWTEDGIIDTPQSTGARRRHGQH